MTHPDDVTLAAALPAICSAPTDDGSLALIVRRPEPGEREVLDEGVLDLADGLVGDSWSKRPSRSTPDGTADPAAQLTVMSVRVADIVATGADAPYDPRALAGDQLFVDLDLSEANVPAGTRLAIGEAVIEVSAKPHTGCAKFRRWYGDAAGTWVNAPDLRHLRLRGLNARVVQPGVVRRGDRIRKVDPSLG